MLGMSGIARPPNPLMDCKLRASMAFLAITGGLLAGIAGAAERPLSFAIAEGRNHNLFYQGGPVAAHVVLRDGTSPRLLVAFPAGNSGAALWFSALEHPASWHVDRDPAPIEVADSHHRLLHGITCKVSIDAPGLSVRVSGLGSIRMLRDIESGKAEPAAAATSPRVTGNSISWARDRIDGAAGYRLVLEVTHGAVTGASRIVAGKDGRISMNLTVATGEVPLHAFAAADLFVDGSAAQTELGQALRFLSYREKFLAGSWRFDTYFGRDTLMSLRLLMPALKPEPVEAGLRSVIARLNAEGEVAHEEDIGEWAILDHLASDGTIRAEPVYDYKMIDATFMLAPVLEAWLIEDARGADRARAFLASRAGDGAEPVGLLLLRNLRRVLRTAEPFGNQPVFGNLISLKSGVPVGNWRDSDAGLGGGRFPFDVNAVLVPAALRAIDRIYRRGWLKPYLEAGDEALFTSASGLSGTWREKAPAFFDVNIPEGEARAAQSEVLGQLGLSGVLLPVPGEVRFPALALDSAGNPIPIEHSDVGFALLFGLPDEQELLRLLGPLRPFPAGLLTEAGVLVANPVFAPASLRAQFGRGDYHGMVIWSWQQALLAAGVSRQLARMDLGADSRDSLHASQQRLRQLILRTRRWQASELWSWSIEEGRFVPAAFGASATDVDESNAAQLWSTVFLGLTGFSN
jgi:hypothetical protein